METTKWLTGLILIGYILAYLVDKNIVEKALARFVGMVVSIAPTLLLIFFFLFVSHHYINPKKIKKHLGEGHGLKGWLIVIVGGLLSTGPVYVWFPLLANLRKHGMKNSLLTCFIYNRGVKLPLLPLLISYFGLAFTVLLTFWMVIGSVVDGLIIEKLVED